jgi:small-conductance mechanosensitive channel
MSLHAQIEAAESIARQAIASTLQHNRLRSVPLHDALDDRLEDVFVRLVIDTVSKWEVDGVVFAWANSDVTEFPGPREVLAIFVERNGHHTVGGIERFFHTITVMNVNIDIEHSLLVAEELNDPKNDVWLK